MLLGVGGCPHVQSPFPSPLLLGAGSSAGGGGACISTGSSAGGEGGMGLGVGGVHGAGWRGWGVGGALGARSGPVAPQGAGWWCSGLAQPPTPLNLPKQCLKLSTMLISFGV